MEKQTYHIKSSLSPAIVTLSNRSYIVPAWVEVPVGTTLDQVTWSKDFESPKPDSNIFEVPSSDGKGFYQVQKVGLNGFVIVKAIGDQKIECVNILNK